MGLRWLGDLDTQVHRATDREPTVFLGLVGGVSVTVVRLVVQGNYLRGSWRNGSPRFPRRIGTSTERGGCLGAGGAWFHPRNSDPTSPRSQQQQRRPLPAFSKSVARVPGGGLEGPEIWGPVCPSALLAYRRVRGAALLLFFFASIAALRNSRRREDAVRSVWNAGIASAISTRAVQYMSLPVKLAQWFTLSRRSWSPRYFLMRASVQPRAARSARDRAGPK